MFEGSIKGVGVSPGIVIGSTNCCLSPDERSLTIISPAEVLAELEKLQRAVLLTKQDLYNLYVQASEKLPAAEAAIFEAHTLMIDDPSMFTEIERRISELHYGAEQAVHETIECFAQQLEQIEDDYLCGRASDIREIGRRIIRHLTGRNGGDVALMEAAIIVAQDLGPGEVLGLDKSKILGMITEQGSSTSHVAILARTLGIPCVVGVRDICSVLKHGITIALDGTEGIVVIDPSEEDKRVLMKRAGREKERSIALELLVNQPSSTEDGKHMELWANIGRPEDAAAALNVGAGGIGLFRTEFLFMDRAELPSEAEQEAAYRQALSAMQGRPVVIRTLDIGADKRLSYLNLPAEENPYLGVRGIRLCLQEREIFKAQLRALLRASTAGELWIMFPMITVMEELLECKSIFQTVREEVICGGTPVSAQLKIGIMVETPAVALLADRFAKQVDFFSIGTNDLLQYTMAADRQNPSVAYLHDPLHPAVVTLIANTVRAAKARKIPVGMCGEMAGNPEFIEYLVGLDLDKLSMSAGSILKVKEQLRLIHSEAAAEKIDTLLGRRT